MKRFMIILASALFYLELLVFAGASASSKKG